MSYTALDMAAAQDKAFEAGMLQGLSTARDLLADIFRESARAGDHEAQKVILKGIRKIDQTIDNHTQEGN